ncbi:TerD family protein [archaeon]|nr:TerD family protein [archaeon]
MSVVLTKGGNVNLSKENPSLNKITIGLGWDVRVTDGAGYDLDASAFLLNTSNKVRSDNDFIFYNCLKSECGSVVHQGDNRTGDGDGDDESLKIQLNKVPSSIEKVAFIVTIHDAEKRGQNFGQVNGAFIRIVNDESGKEVARYDLSEDASNVTAMIFGELYRAGSDWKFKAIGQGFNNGLGPLAQNYGVDIG